MGTFISRRSHQFAYFDTQLGHPDWASATVLDFGGNAGNILLDQDSAIDPEKYWCLDVSRDAIELGRWRYPGAHFVFYDRYNVEFNPTGVPGLPVPDLGPRFDIILAYSVFTHTSRGETRSLVAGLRSLLAPGGVLAFSFVDPDFVPPEGWVDESRDDERLGLDNLSWRLTLSRGPEQAAVMAARARRNPLTWATFVNNEHLVTDSGDGWGHQGAERAPYFAFCTEEHMRAIYPDAEVRPPARPQRHSCCVIRNRPVDEE